MKKPASTTKRNLSVSLENNLKNAAWFCGFLNQMHFYQKFAASLHQVKMQFSMLYFSVIFQDCFRLKENQKCLEQVFLLRYSMNEYLSFR